MADWPERDELQQILDVQGDDWDLTLDRVLASAIEKVKQDVGQWDDDVDVPDDSLSQAALRMAELISERPGTPVAHLSKDAAYVTLLTGHRRSFGIG